MKMYVMNWDGRNDVACLAKTKKEALKIIGSTSYQFSNYGYVYPEDEVPSSYGKLPEEGKAFYKPIGDYGNKYSWRETRYEIYWDENKNSQYK